MSEEEVEEKQLEEESCSNGRLRNILKSKFGFGVPKNKQAAAMNAILILRPKHSERRDEEVFKLAFHWMKTLIHRVWILYRFSQVSISMDLVSVSIMAFIVCKNCCNYISAFLYGAERQWGIAYKLVISLPKMPLNRSEMCSILH